MKGIILAGGKGTRLYPITHPICKQLLPIYDKPLIYYPLSVLIMAGIKDILIITTKEDIPRFKMLLNNGSHLGLNIQYEYQENPNGIAQAFIIGESFIGDDSVCLILGDNLFYGNELPELFQKITQSTIEGAYIFGYHVRNPSEYGVVDFDDDWNIKSIEEKPNNPQSNFAVVGLYFYDNSVIEISKNLKPSARGELEITDVNREYLKRNKLKLELLGRGIAWFDTGTHDSMADAISFVKSIQHVQGFKVGCIEEVSYRKGFIDDNMLIEIANPLIKSGYGEYLLSLLNEKKSRK